RGGALRRGGGPGMGRPPRFDATSPSRVSGHQVGPRYPSASSAPPVREGSYRTAPVASRNESLMRAHSSVLKASSRGRGTIRAGGPMPDAAEEPLNVYDSDGNVVGAQPPPQANPSGLAVPALTVLP